jgi:hypothetical protein
MRIKLLINSLFIAILIIAFTPSVLALTEAEAIAACAARTTCTTCTGVCGRQNCTYSKAYTSYLGGYRICDMICWDQYMVEVDAGPYKSIAGLPGVTCAESCTYVTDPALATNQSCIEESAEDILCNCDNPADPTPTPAESGGGSTPAPTAVPTDPPSLTSSIGGRVQEDDGAALSGNFCSQATVEPLPNDNYIVSTGGSAGVFSASVEGAYEATVLSGDTYTVTLDLSNQTGLVDYICSCPAALDPNNPYLCRYSGVSAGATNVNFYLQASNLSNTSWFQVFGGNFFGRNGIASNVPATFCAIDASCQAALSALPIGSSNQNSSGFAINNATNSDSVISNSNVSATHSYLHQASRINNVNSYAVDTDINQLSYDYFYKLAGDSAQAWGDGGETSPLLSAWTSSPWWKSDDVNYVQINGNLNINETQAFNISSGQSLVVFVDGNLTLSDSNSGDSNTKITRVDGGGFLAFIVNGDILVAANVGHAVFPTTPTVPVTSVANSNLEGVFIADGTLTIGSRFDLGETVPDRKFIGAGTFVGWTNVNLDRTFDDGDLGPLLNNNQAIENFIYRPDLLANWPTKLKASLSNWREVDPQLIDQE